MPSKKVYLKCNRPFIHAQIRSAEAVEQLNMAKKSVGSYFVNKHSTRKGTGLTEEELVLLLPKLLDIPADDAAFRKEVDKFYTEINTLVPYEKGLELEIGLATNNSKPLTEYVEEEDPKDPTRKIKKYINLPIHIEDYVKYRHAMKHPYCAESPVKAKGNQTVTFYIEDPEETLKNNISESDKRDDALNVYQQIKDDAMKVKAVLTILQGFIKKKPGEVLVIEALSDEQRRIRLRDLATDDKHYKKFYEAATDKDITKKYLLRELLRVNLLKRAGTSILVGESNEMLGENENDAVVNLFENTANAQLLASLKAEYRAKKEKDAIGK